MSSYPTWNRKFQKIAKKFKKLENTIIVSFQAKIGQERLRKNEKKKKKIDLMYSYPTRNRKFQKNSKKIQKTRKHRLSIFTSQNRLGKPAKERK